MQVTVHIRSDIARKLSIDELDTPEATEITDAANELGIVLRPVHPRVNDAALASYFAVTVPDAETGRLVIARLRKCQAIDAAYLKPTATLP